jgi:hypothetical protein
VFAKAIPDASGLICRIWSGSRFNQFSTTARRTLGLIGIVGILPSRRPQYHDDGLKQKYIRNSSDGVRRVYRDVADVWEISRAGSPTALVVLLGGSGGILRAGQKRPRSLGLAERATGAGNVGLVAFLNRDPHFAEMPIDSKRLSKDCAHVQAEIAANGLAHRRTGATAIIEHILPCIEQLRTQKHSWAAIAAALAKQGVVQGANRDPISGRRLTALISAINKRERRREARLLGRAKRRDLAPLPQSSHTLALSADLNRTNATTTVIAADSEATIRHQEFEDRIRSLLKADTP